MSAVKAERYATYKDCGVEWLGEMPDHWQTKRIKELSRIISKGTTPSTEGFVFIDSGVRFIKAENVGYTKNVSNTPAFFISEEANAALSRSQLKSNDLLLVIAGATIGKVGLVVEDLLPANTNQAVCFIRFKNRHDISYLYYLFASDYLFKYIWFSVVQSAQPNLAMGVLGDFLLFMPPRPEQTAIAAYLDTKTAQLDSQIDLLGQKAAQYGKLKQSLINETITRGLNKSVPMKDSGVEWVGEIPEHWPVMRLKDVCSIQKGDVFDFDTEDESGKIPYFNGGMTPSGFSHFSNMPSGVIAVSEGGASSGYTQFMDSPFWCGAHCYAIFSKTKCKKYLYYCIKGWEHVLSELKTGSAMPNLKKSEISNFLVPITKNREEQAAITAYLDEKTAQIDRIVTAINTQIDKFKDLRKTLINDVVTGKIKVVSEGTGV